MLREAVAKQKAQPAAAVQQQQQQLSCVINPRSYVRLCHLR